MTLGSISGIIFSGPRIQHIFFETLVSNFWVNNTEIMCQLTQIFFCMVPVKKKFKQFFLLSFSGIRGQIQVGSARQEVLSSKSPEI
jgi:hypothetical protein